jgi:hypothetical protein
MLSYHLLDHSIYSLPRVSNILDWTPRGGDALTFPPKRQRQILSAPIGCIHVFEIFCRMPFWRWRDGDSLRTFLMLRVLGISQLLTGRDPR